MTTVSNFFVAFLQSSGANNALYYDALTRILTLVVVYWIALRLRMTTLELRNAKLSLERLNHEKNLLIGVISHDVRGALGVMLASSRLLKKSASRLSQDRIDLIADQTQTAAQNSLTLLEDLLEWSRSQISGTTLQSRPVSILGVIDASIETQGTERNARSGEIPVARRMPVDQWHSQPHSGP